MRERTQAGQFESRDKKCANEPKPGQFESRARDARTNPSMREPLSSEAVQILRSGFPAHPLSPSASVDLACLYLTADEVVVHPTRIL